MLTEKNAYFQNVLLFYGLIMDGYQHTATSHFFFAGKSLQHLIILFL